MRNVRQWWDKIEFGPYLGYFPKASKSWLVVKAEKLEKTKEMFAGTGANITTEGYVGTRDRRNDVIIPGKLNNFAGTSTQIIRIGPRNNRANFHAFSTIGA